MHTTSGYGIARYPTQRKRVVIIDDDDELCGMLRNFLEKCGWEVHPAPTGKGGLELTSQCRPDLILLDLVLPDCDGFEVLRRIRRERFTPILIISAKGEEADRIVGIELGADDYLTKPFSVRELLARMEAVLRRCSFHIGPESSESFMVGEFTIDSS